MNKGFQDYYDPALVRALMTKWTINMKYFTFIQCAHDKLGAHTKYLWLNTLWSPFHKIVLFKTKAVCDQIVLAIKFLF